MRVLTQSSSGSAVNHECIYYDYPFPALTTREAAFKPVLRKGDSLELEWLQVLGVKVFSASGSQVELALGAAESELSVALKAAARQRVQARAARARTIMSGIKVKSVSMQERIGRGSYCTPVHTASNFTQGAASRRSIVKEQLDIGKRKQLVGTP